MNGDRNGGMENYRLMTRRNSIIFYGKQGIAIGLMKTKEFSQLLARANKTVIDLFNLSTN